MGMSGAAVLLLVESSVAKPRGERSELDGDDNDDNANRVPSKGPLFESGVRRFTSVTTDMLSVAIVTASVSVETTEKSSSSVREGDVIWDKRRDF